MEKQIQKYIKGCFYCDSLITMGSCYIVFVYSKYHPENSHKPNSPQVLKPKFTKCAPNSNSNSKTWFRKNSELLCIIFCALPSASDMCRDTSCEGLWSSFLVFGVKNKESLRKEGRWELYDHPSWRRYGFS